MEDREPLPAWVKGLVNLVEFMILLFLLGMLLNCVVFPMLRG